MSTLTSARHLASELGARVISAAEDAGGMAIILARAIRSLYPLDIDRDELVRAMYKFGVMSVPIVLATAFFAGGIMVLQAAMYIAQFGAYSLVGWGAGFVTLREMGPLLIGLMFSGRVGANNAAELATMTVTEQIDALRVLAIDPFRFLVLPRIIAMIVMLLVLTTIGDLVAIMGGGLVAKLVMNLDPRIYLNSIVEMVKLADLGVGLFKSVIFGGVIAIVSSHFGLTVKGGSQGVGRAVNACVVATAISIFIVDYFMTAVFG